MATPKEDRKPSFLYVFKNKCPRCRRGDMFKNKNPYNLRKMMQMNDKCEVCKQPFDIEVGFYFGASYVAYAMTVAMSVATFIAYWVFFGFDLYDNSIIYWLIVNAVVLLIMQPLFMRLARAIWLSFFVRYNKNYKTEPPKDTGRTNADLQNAW
ncbi:uncharacterized protein (DUF983 family) [Chitinophaga skermanii]|uniref:Uncharacterized protein (DUF983 family) n=1 Tax=Chitinophaga skermanii TaxID=331697 RepID=A0A327QQG3_9BACT|nr:DUF983 domain-containing protein [Chitinophaga skermanii]RAJ06580.1 uncharacterized protein (DUF983 family) [Chitinophaga skermanii]